jgi:hypothetical protein
MAIETAIWRMTSEGPRALTFSTLGTEKRLEDMVVADPSLTGLDVLVVGRQVPTTYGGYVDVLAIDADAHVHVVELKRGRTPRDVVAQALDYGSWARDLTLDLVEELYARSGGKGTLAGAFAAKYNFALPDVFNPDQHLTIVASALDSASDRIVEYLSTRYGVPINAVFFRYFADGDAEYLTRTWLLAPSAAEVQRPRPGSASKVRSWNGRDYYVILGSVERGADRWSIGRRYGFVGAGGGEWYSRWLRHLAPGLRVFAYVGGAGYVGVGEVIGEMTPLRDFVSEVEGAPVKVIDQPDVVGEIRDRALNPDPDITEYAVPVRWIATRPTSEAVKEPGLFASQASACKLKDERTIEVVSAAFGLE